jgi:hypothetical protein
LCSWGEGKQKKTVITKRYKPCCAKTFVWDRHGCLFVFHIF